MLRENESSAEMHLQRTHFEGAIAEHPDELSRYVAYGEWMKRVGDPRGEAVLLDCNERGLGGDGAQDRSEALDGLFGREEMRLPDLIPGGVLHMSFRCGLISDAVVVVRDNEHNAEHLAALLADPSFRFASRLSVDAWAGEDVADLSYVCPVFESANLPLLRRVGLSRSKRARVTPITGIEALKVRGAHARFEGVHQGVRRLRLGTDDLDWNTPSFPDLGVLELRYIERHAEWLPAVLGSESFPKLRELRFNGLGGHLLIDALKGAPLLESLRVLDLTNALNDASARTLLMAARRFDRVERIYAGNDGSMLRAAIGLASRDRDQGQYETPAAGTLDMQQRWKDKLASTFGERLSFEIPKGYPHYREW